MIKTLAHFFSFCLFFSVCETSCLYAKAPISSGLPIPRFAALRSADVNLRTGPGTRYPISWIIKKKFLPVKVIAEQENWRKIELHDGTIGWVFQSMLTGNKTAMVNVSKTYSTQISQTESSASTDNKTTLTNAPKAFLRRAPQAGSSIIATIGDGVIAQLKLCKGNWCRLIFNDYTGWIERQHLWGAEFDKK